MNAVRIKQNSAYADALEMHIITQAQSLLTVAGRAAEPPSYTEALEILATRPTYNYENNPPPATSDGVIVSIRSVE